METITERSEPGTYEEPEDEVQEVRVVITKLCTFNDWQIIYKYDSFGYILNLRWYITLT